MGNTSAGPETRFRHLLRALRPLLWWAALILVLFGVRTHQRWMSCRGWAPDRWRRTQQARLKLIFDSLKS